MHRRKGARYVSIHAPAWGATVIDELALFPRGVSIHAPAWGATNNRSNLLLTSHRFNPRARVGRDQI